MTSINVYNDNADMIRRMAIKNNISVEEVIDHLIDVASETGLAIPTENETHICYANAEYAGGGVYIYWGKLGENYFLINHVYGTTAFGMILDVCPDIADDDTFTPEWQEAHTVKDLPEDELYRFIISVIDWISANHPEGNYALYELESRRSDLLSEMAFTSVI